MQHAKQWGERPLRRKISIKLTQHMVRPTQRHDLVFLPGELWARREWHARSHCRGHGCRRAYICDDREHCGQPGAGHHHPHSGYTAARQYRALVAVPHARRRQPEHRGRAGIYAYIHTARPRRRPPAAGYSIFIPVRCRLPPRAASHFDSGPYWYSVLF